MALLSLSVKRHLAEEFPIAASGTAHSPPIFCSSQIRLLSSNLHKSSLTHQPEGQTKKRRKQQRPLFLTESVCATGDGVSDSSVDELDRFQDGVSTQMAARSEDLSDIRKADDDMSDVAANPRNGTDKEEPLEQGSITVAGLTFVNKVTRPASSQSFEENSGKYRDELGSKPSVPSLQLLSQGASDTMGHVSSSSSSSSLTSSSLLPSTSLLSLSSLSSGQLKLQPSAMACLKLEAEELGSITERMASEGELLGGDSVADDGTAEVCPDCKKVFKRKIYLQRHIAREHWSLAKIFKCEKCSYETKHQSNLLVHRRTHTGERPYHCGACGQRYTQGHLLKAHIRSRHGADMRFYNMDKRTDGIRCRRLLGAKLLGGGKEDRIRFLLQAAEAARQHPSPPAPRAMFGGMMPPAINEYMNVLSCLPNGIRPILWPSVAGGFLGSSGFQGSPLQNGMPSHAALLSSLAAPLSLTSDKISSNDHPPKVTGSILSSMLTLPSSAIPFQAIKMENFSDEKVSKVIVSSANRNGIQNSHNAPVSSLDFPLMPEDLTTTRRRTGGTASEKQPDRVHDKTQQAVSVGFSHNPLSTLTHAASMSVNVSTNGESVSAADLTSQGNCMDRGSLAILNNVDSSSISQNLSGQLFVNQNEKYLQSLKPSDLTLFAADGQKLSLDCNNGKLSFVYSRSELFQNSSQSNCNSVVTSSPPFQSHNDLASQPPASTSAGCMDTDLQNITLGPLGQNSDDDKAEGKFNLGGTKPDGQMTKPLPLCHSTCAESMDVCKESCCPYLQKLKDLRRNVYRMLCVFTPYLGVADINDYEADSIDEFLHEVIYSKLDDTD